MPKPVSLRITSETRTQLDELVKRTGLKEAQVIRLAIRQMSDLALVVSATAPTPARRKR